MKTDYMLLSTALAEIDRRVSAAIGELWDQRHPHSYDKPRPVFHYGDEVNAKLFWFASMDAIWDFWVQSPTAWSCPEGSHPIRIVLPEAFGPPTCYTDFDNGFVDLFTSKMIRGGIISGNADHERTCSAGETVVVSSREVTSFFSRLEKWVDEVVCTPGADEHSRDDNDPRYIDFRSASSPVRPKSLKQKREWYIKYVASFEDPAHPNKKQRHRDCSESGIVQAESDKLHAELSPEYWKKIGRRKQVEPDS